jgi:hypothetical protein
VKTAWEFSARATTNGYLERDLVSDDPELGFPEQDGIIEATVRRAVAPEVDGRASRVFQEAELD